MLSRSCGVLVGDRLRAHGVSTACTPRVKSGRRARTVRARRAHGVHTTMAASHDVFFKTARR